MVMVPNNGWSLLLKRYRNTWIFVLLMVLQLLIINWLWLDNRFQVVPNEKRELEGTFEKFKSKVGMQYPRTFDCSQIGDITGYHQSDTLLIEIIKHCFLNEPSKQPYNLLWNDVANRKGQFNQTTVISQMYQRKLVNRGFYIECGGYDGESISNSLYFELEEGWRGLLIEPDPSNFKVLIGKNRKAWTANNCLSTEPNPMIIGFYAAGASGGISESSELKVTCLPFTSIMQALNSPPVHYFSLDVEGAEYKILKTIDWRKVDIWLMGIEIAHDAVGRIEMRKILESNNYEYIGTVFEHQNTYGATTDPCNCTAVDDFYLRKDKFSEIDDLSKRIQPYYKDPNFVMD